MALKDKISQEAYTRFERFLELANIGDLHPLDEERWREFVIQTHREGVELYDSDISEAIRDRYPRASSAVELGARFVDERELLKQFESRGRRPLIQAAALCERILHEQDNTISAIRMVDRFRIPKDAPAEAFVQATILLCLKSGSYEGSFPVRFQIRRPSGAVKGILPQAFEAHFKGTGTDGSNFMIGVNIGIQERGLHYIEAVRGDEVLASIPFTLEEAPREPPRDSAEDQKA